MNLQALLGAPIEIRLHAFAALGAVGLGAAQLVSTKGTMPHRIRGYVWSALMLIVAVSSFWIHNLRLIGPFSPIHLLSILTLVTLPRAIYLARRGDVAGHRRIMLMLFWFALVGAGLFTLLPGRIMGAVLLGV